MTLPTLPCLPTVARIAATALFSLCAAGAQAQVFTFKDWALGCDNKHHCEAVGFRAETSDSKPVVLWIARDAGPGTPVRGRVTAQAEGHSGKDFHLTIGQGASAREMDGEDIDPESFARLLPRLLDSPSADVRLGTQHYTLSLSGLKAAMLKMDDLQGRIRTPGALVRKGSRPESDVPEQLVAPYVRAAVPFQNRSTDDQLLQAILPTLTSECSVPATQAVDGADVTIHRVSPSQVIVLRECVRGAYQSFYAAWLVDDKPPYAAQRQSFPLVGGRSVDRIAGAEFGKLMRSITKGRAEDDCGADAFWMWTGQAFELVNAHEAPLCRGMAGGGFTLRTYQTRHED